MTDPDHRSATADPARPVALGSNRRWLILSAVAAVTAAGAGWQLWRPVPGAAGDGATRLSVAQAHAAVREGLLLVDIRTPGEWRLTGLGQGAVPLDMRRDDFLAVLAALAGGDPGRPVAVICARGVRSARMAKAMVQAGFTQVRDVPEGMLGSAAGPGWLAQGLPVVPWDGTEPGARG